MNWAASIPWNLDLINHGTSRSGTKVFNPVRAGYAAAVNPVCPGSTTMAS